MEYLLLGKITGSFALDGTLKVFSNTNRQVVRYKQGKQVLLGLEKKPLTVVSCRVSGQFDFVQVEEITTKEQADELKGQELFVIKDESDLENDEFFFSDLESCQVIDQENNRIGRVIKVEEFPAQLTLRCKSLEGKEFFVPFIKAFILEVDISRKIIKVQVIGGML